MGTVKATGETIVDLYCGIGYYTLPFLVHANAAIVHAFEWNPNSVAALMTNLSVAAISRSRCIIHFGDNVSAVLGHSTPPMLAEGHCIPQFDSTYTVRNVSTECEEDALQWSTKLRGIANRVCLGLLPSSSRGWLSAVTVMCPAGGMIHLHYNVNDREIQDWVQQACIEFESLFFSIGKPMRVQFIHIEKVKSYAPRVKHIVADLHCLPI